MLQRHDDRQHEYKDNNKNNNSYDDSHKHVQGWTSVTKKMTNNAILPITVSDSASSMFS